MPIYEYQCESCGFQTEILQKMSDSPLMDCSDCNKPTMKKLISSSAFRLKGTGWYATDFKDSKAGKASPASASDSKQDSSVSKNEDNAAKDTKSD